MDLISTDRNNSRYFVRLTTSTDYKNPVVFIMNEIILRRKEINSEKSGISVMFQNGFMSMFEMDHPRLDNNNSLAIRAYLSPDNTKMALILMMWEKPSTSNLLVMINSTDRNTYIQKYTHYIHNYFEWNNDSSTVAYLHNKKLYIHDYLINLPVLISDDSNRVRSFIWSNKCNEILFNFYETNNESLDGYRNNDTSDLCIYNVITRNTKRIIEFEKQFNEVYDSLHLFTTKYDVTKKYDSSELILFTAKELDRFSEETQTVTYKVFFGKTYTGGSYDINI